ncbi:hypothetical protein ARMSODRAFT_964944 [Armillaria solidipes]|uniref:NAD(P)-binding protein n=1 Tax=Armillaria solidipes TaxID=1076256 RepID=A0A2H3B2R8_9AGAR|nr:hypothetical protein ARMSODRAFT_964944 [Armillaria solidipes]
MTILPTGRTGKTATRISLRGVKFDWHDPSTFENVFTTDPNIDRIYLVAPGATSERFVLLTASTMADGYPLMGPKAHEYLLSLKVDYAVLRPSWFFENFLTVHLRTIKEQNTIISAFADGKIGFTSADDIANLAVSALTDEKSHNTDHIITGPELLSYDDAQVLGRKITHTRITVEELKQRYTSFGLPEGFAGMLSSLDGLNANGGEEEIFKAPKKVTGKRTLRSFVEANNASF